MEDLNQVQDPAVEPAQPAASAAAEPVVEPAAEAQPEPVVERVIPARVLVKKSDAAIEVAIRDEAHYDQLIAIHGVGSLEALS